MDETQRRHRAELDDVLLNGSPKTLRKFMKRHGMKLPSSDEVLRVTFHKAISVPRAAARGRPLACTSAAIGRDAALGADLSRLRPETKSAKFADLIRRWAPEMLAPYRR
jgi:hypothetical protein